MSDSERFVVKLDKVPEKASSYEQGVVRSLMATRARLEVLELYFKRYEEARESGAPVPDKGAITGEEIRDALNRAEESTRRACPGYLVRVELGQMYQKNPNEQS